MEMDQVYQNMDHLALIDVRTRYEYDTLHIKDARNIPLDKDTLPTAVRALRATTARPIVFYCNGHTCKKSYEAAELAINAGIDRVYAYDAGIESWVHRYPDRSVLLGHSPVQPGDLISLETFKQRVIPSDEFESRMEQGAMVLDIRDTRQRDVALFPFKETRATLDDKQKLLDAVNTAKRANKTLLIYDKVGKQTRWFQYFLEQQAVKDYYFMDGGEEGYFDLKFGKPKVPNPDRS
jgi:rhodanese-related sulfurtransferase